jgi:hypothetical protein
VNGTRDRSAILRRIKSSFQTVLRDLRDEDFQRVFQMQRLTFSFFLNVIRPDLERDSEIAFRSSGGRIVPEVRLSL